MSIRRLFFFALVASVIHLAPFFSYSTHSAFAAGDKEEEEEEEREVQLGVIAGEQRGGFEGLTSGSSSTVSDSITGELPPVTGSVSKVGQNKMLAKLTNNHEENKYSLNFQIHQLDKWGKKLKSTSFSAVLAPKGEWERTLSRQFNAAQLQLEITSARNLTPKKKKDEEGEVVEEKKPQPVQLPVTQNTEKRRTRTFLNPPQ